MFAYDDLLERIQAEAVSEGLDEIRLAREEFHKLTGEFDEGEPWYDLRMHMFQDWYLLDRVGPEGLTPTELYLVNNRARLGPEDTAQVLNLTVTLRSVFRIARIRGEQRFSTPDELRARIDLDVDQARALLAHTRAFPAGSGCATAR